MEFNRQELSQAMGVSLPTVDRWIRDGCPMKQRGTKGVPWVFSLPDVVAWWGDRQRESAAGSAPTDVEDARRRKLSAEAAMAELELAKARGDVAPIREFEMAQSRMMAVIRTNILNVPSRVVLQLLGETDEKLFKSKLRAELTLALEQSADEDIDIEDDDGE
jgi:phage terminase Nu1 subunit (DNA packaging protein)